MDAQPSLQDHIGCQDVNEITAKQVIELTALGTTVFNDMVRYYSQFGFLTTATYEEFFYGVLLPNVALNKAALIEQVDDDACEKNVDQE